MGGNLAPHDMMRFEVSARRHPYELVRSGATLRLERRGPNGHAVLRSIIALILSGFAWFLGEALGSWRWIEVDSEERRIRGRRDAYLLWGFRRVEIPADAIRSLRVLRVQADGVPEGGYSQIRVVHHGRKWLLSSGEKDTFLTFYRDEHGRRADFLEFAFRVGRMLGFPGYRLARDDHLRMEVELMPSGEGTPLTLRRVVVLLFDDVYRELLASHEAHDHRDGDHYGRHEQPSTHPEVRAGTRAQVHDVADPQPHQGE